MTWQCWRDASHSAVRTTRFGWPQCSICKAAPPYHERVNHLPTDLRLGVYVPAGQGLSTVAPRSGVVGVVENDERTLIHYEGWVYSAGQYTHLGTRDQWGAAIDHAASRLVTGYPTTAQMMTLSSRLLVIGSYDPSTRNITITNERALEEWLSTGETA